MNETIFAGKYVCVCVSCGATVLASGWRGNATIWVQGWEQIASDGYLLARWTFGVKKHKIAQADDD